MDLRKKLEVTQRAIDSVAQHTDLDDSVVLAALDRVQAQVDQARKDIAAKAAEQLKTTLGE
jgi:hypothetical protein